MVMCNDGIFFDNIKYYVDITQIFCFTLKLFICEYEVLLVLLDISSDFSVGNLVEN